ncbi:hypothetical protein KIPB_013696, partial [Kipferlia bialata]|eukprot:g13696.t1
MSVVGEQWPGQNKGIFGN